MSEFSSAQAMFSSPDKLTRADADDWGTFGSPSASHQGGKGGGYGVDAGLGHLSHGHLLSGIAPDAAQAFQRAGLGSRAGRRSSRGSSELPASHGGKGGFQPGVTPLRVDSPSHVFASPQRRRQSQHGGLVGPQTTASSVRSAAMEESKQPSFGGYASPMSQLFSPDRAANATPGHALGRVPRSGLATAAHRSAQRKEPRRMTPARLQAIEGAPVPMSSPLQGQVCTVGAGTSPPGLSPLAPRTFMFGGGATSLASSPPGGKPSGRIEQTQGMISPPRRLAAVQGVKELQQDQWSRAAVTDPTQCSGNKTLGRLGQLRARQAPAQGSPLQGGSPANAALPSLSSPSPARKAMLPSLPAQLGRADVSPNRGSRAAIRDPNLGLDSLGVQSSAKAGALHLKDGPISGANQPGLGPLQPRTRRASVDSLDGTVNRDTNQSILPATSGHQPDRLPAVSPVNASTASDAARRQPPTQARHGVADPLGKNPRQIPLDHSNDSGARHQGSHLQFGAMDVQQLGGQQDEQARLPSSIMNADRRRKRISGGETMKPHVTPSKGRQSGAAAINGADSPSGLAQDARREGSSVVTLPALPRTPHVALDAAASVGVALDNGVTTRPSSQAGSSELARGNTDAVSVAATTIGSHSQSSKIQLTSQPNDEPPVSQSDGGSQTAPGVAHVSGDITSQRRLSQLDVDDKLSEPHSSAPGDAASQAVSAALGFDLGEPSHISSEVGSMTVPPDAVDRTNVHSNVPSTAMSPRQDQTDTGRPVEAPAAGIAMIGASAIRAGADHVGALQGAAGLSAACSGTSHHESTEQRSDPTTSQQKKSAIGEPSSVPQPTAQSSSDPKANSGRAALVDSPDEGVPQSQVAPDSNANPKAHGKVEQQQGPCSQAGLLQETAVSTDSAPASVRAAPSNGASQTVSAKETTPTATEPKVADQHPSSRLSAPVPSSALQGGSMSGSLASTAPTAAASAVAAASVVTNATSNKLPREPQSIEAPIARPPSGQDRSPDPAPAVLTQDVKSPALQETVSIDRTEKDSTGSKASSEAPALAAQSTPGFALLQIQTEPNSETSRDGEMDDRAEAQSTHAPHQAEEGSSHAFVVPQTPLGTPPSVTESGKAFVAVAAAVPQTPAGEPEPHSNGVFPAVPQTPAEDPPMDFAGYTGVDSEHKDGNAAADQHYQQQEHGVTDWTDDSHHQSHDWHHGQHHQHDHRQQHQAGYAEHHEHRPTVAEPAEDAADHLPMPGPGEAPCQFCLGAGAYALHFAASCGHMECLQQLMLGDMSGLNQADDLGRSPLFFAAARNHMECCAVLIDTQPTWVDAGDQNADTPVHVAAARGNLESLSILLDSGARATQANLQGITPTHAASTDACLEKLIEAGGDIFAIDKVGRCPLFTMAATGRTEAAMLLCSRDDDLATVSMPDQRGDTPLHAAASNGQRGMVVALLQAGADSTLSNKAGLTAERIAAMNRHRHVVRVLARHREVQAGTRPQADAIFTADPTPTPQSANAALQAALMAEASATGIERPLEAPSSASEKQAVMFGAAAEAALGVASVGSRRNVSVSGAVGGQEAVVQGNTTVRRELQQPPQDSSSTASVHATDAGLGGVMQNELDHGATGNLISMALGTPSPTQEGGYDGEAAPGAESGYSNGQQQHEGSWHNDGSAIGHPVHAAQEALLWHEDPRNRLGYEVQPENEVDRPMLNAWLAQQPAPGSAESLHAPYTLQDVRSIADGMIAQSAEVSDEKRATLEEAELAQIQQLHDALGIGKSPEAGGSAAHADAEKAVDEVGHGGGGHAVPGPEASQGAGQSAASEEGQHGPNGDSLQSAGGDHGGAVAVFETWSLLYDPTEQSYYWTDAQTGTSQWASYGEEGQEGVVRVTVGGDDGHTHSWFVAHPLKEH